MDVGAGPGAEVLSPGEADWPPELRLPPPPPMPEPPRPPPPAATSWAAPAPRLHMQPPAAPPPRKDPSPPPRHAEGFDDQHFLGSIMGAAAPPQQQQQHHHQQQQTAAGAAPVKRKRGRPPKNRDGAPAAPAPVKPVSTKEEEVVCFICFDGGNLVVCDRRGCPKVYHPACIKRDESFFRARGKWDCGWHICSSCEKAVQYMCYTCTYSVCRGCVKQGKFFGVRGNKGFCDTCYGTILLIESKDGGAKVGVDFDDITSWEYLFKLYWLDLKGKHSLTLEELTSAKSRWTVPSTAGRREKEESSDELYDANDDKDASFDISSKKRKQNNSSGKRGQKRKKDSSITSRKCEISINSAGSLPNGPTSEGMPLPGDTKWASSVLLEFIGHMRNGDSSYISQYDVQVLLLEYIKQNNLRDPRRKSQIICDARLSNLFGKSRVGHFEMLKLLDMHYLVKQAPTLNADGQREIDSDSAQVDNGGYSELTAKVGSDKRRKAHKKIERELAIDPEDYAAIDMHNINLIYLRRSLMEDLIDDAAAAFSDKIAGAFVRIRISGLGHKEDMYRLVKVVGTHKVAERYNVGKKTTDYALEISNLGKKEVITMDTISNQDFTEEECKRLRQSMKFGLTTRLKVGDIYEKAKIFQSLRFKDWLENEKQRLSHLRDRASETGRRKELRECVEKLQLLNTPEEKARRISEGPEVHVDPHMAPNYESAEEQDYKKAVDWTIHRNGSDVLFPGRRGAESSTVENHTQKRLDASSHTSNAPVEDMCHASGAGSDINLNNTAVEPASLGVVSDDIEPEKVWHYKDPSGNVQGPFTLAQLSKWASFFPRDLRIWLTFESEENSLLLTEVLPKQQKDFVQPSAVTTSDKSIWPSTGQDRINPNCANNSSSPVGYNVAYSSALSSQSGEDPTKDLKPLGGTLPSRSLKDSHTYHGQVQHQANYSSTILSSAGSYAPPGSHDERVPRDHVGEWNSCQDNGVIWSPTIPSMNRSWKSNVEQYPDSCTMKDQLQNDSNSHKVSVLTPKQSERDPAASLSTTSPLEFKIMCQQEGSCLSSATNAGAHDLQLSIALAKPEICSPTNPVEDRDSSSASVVSSQCEAPACLPQSVPTSTSSSRKTEVTMTQHKTRRLDASNEPFDQHPEPKSGPLFSSKTQNVESEYPIPTPKLERKETSMKQSGSTSVAPEDFATKSCVLSSVSFVSEPSHTPATKVDSLQSLKERSCLSDRDSTTQMEHLFEESTIIKRSNKVVNPVSDAEGIAVSDVLESLTEQDCEKYSIHGAVPLQNFIPASAEEEQPQCSSPIALSPWGEPNYYQGEAVDSALWGVQDDPGNDMWSMPSPTPALQPSSGPGADGKDASCIIEEVRADQGDGSFVETLPTEGEKKMEQANSNASTGAGVQEKVKPKPNAASGPHLDGSTKASGWQPSNSSQGGNTKASGWQPSNSSQEGNTRASGWKPSALSLEGITNTSDSQPSGPSTQGSTKASGEQRSGSSPDGSRKASGWQRSSTSPEGGRKAPGWQRSCSFTQTSTKAAGWQPSGSSGGSGKADGWQRTSSSPEGSRKASDWHSSGRECGASENRKLSSSHRATTPTGRHSLDTSKGEGNGEKSTAGWEEALGSSSEASKKHGNSDKSAGWGEALGSNRSWHPSSGNASRGSQGNHQHDRHSQGSEFRRGSSNYPRRSDHRHDHGSGGSSRSSSRGQPQRGVCKFYENGHCWKGLKCQYAHR